MRPLALMLLFAAPAALAAPVPKELRKSGLSRLVGSWKQESPGVDNTWKFSADGTATITDPMGRQTAGIKFAFDPNTDPIAFDWVCPWGSWYGVCELKGDTFVTYLRSGKAAAVRNTELKDPGVEAYRFRRIGGDK